MKKIISAILVIALFCLVGCNNISKDGKKETTPKSESASSTLSETTPVNQTDAAGQTAPASDATTSNAPASGVPASDEDSVRYCIGDEDEYFYNGKRYFVDRLRLSQKSVEDADGNYIGELPIGTGSWIGYSHYICGINNKSGILRVVDLDKDLDECIVSEIDLNTYFTESELAESMDGYTRGSFMCAMKGWVYYTTSPLSVKHFILLRTRYGGESTEVLSDGAQYEFPGAGFSKANHVIDGIIYTPAYDNTNEQYSYAEITDGVVKVIPCDDDYYWSLFESSWTL